MNNSASLRSFLAITPSAEVLAAVEGHTQRLRRALRNLPISWEKPEKRHITVQFLGSVEHGRIGAMAEAIEPEMRRIEPFEVIARGTGVFPNDRRPRVLWVGMASATARLFSLHQRLHDVAQPFTPARLDTRFHPHLTIARIRGGEHAVGRALKDVINDDEPEFGKWITSHVDLWSSKLGSGGSTYELIRTFQLSH